MQAGVVVEEMQRDKQGLAVPLHVAIQLRAVSAAWLASKPKASRNAWWVCISFWHSMRLKSYLTHKLICQKEGPAVSVMGGGLHPFSVRLHHLVRMQTADYGV